MGTKVFFFVSALFAAGAAGAQTIATKGYVDGKAAEMAGDTNSLVSQAEVGARLSELARKENLPQ